MPKRLKVTHTINPTKPAGNTTTERWRRKDEEEEEREEEKNEGPEIKFLDLNDHKDQKTHPETSSETSVRLKKELGFIESVGVLIGLVVGSGIFVSPKGVLQYSGSVGVSLIVWAASGMLSMLGALSFIELGTMIPESGGMYSYLHYAFGPVVAFLYMWVTNLTRASAGTAVIAITFGKYFLQLINPTCDEVSDTSARLLAAALLFLLMWINCVNMKWVAKMQNLFMLTKIAALVIIIVLGMWKLADGWTENYESPWKGTNTEVALIAAAFYQSLFSYMGWDFLNLVTEEVKNPNRTLPLAIIVSVTVVTVTYVLANVAYFVVLTPEELLASDVAAKTFGSRVMGILAWTMPVFVALSTFGSVHASVFTQSRLIFVGARKGHFPNAFGLVSTKNYTPIPAVILNVVITVLMLVVPDIIHLINFTSFSATAMQFACILALFWFRYKHPEWPRPFKVWLIVPILFSCVQIFLLIVPLVMAPLKVAGAVGVILSGLPVYYFAIYRQDLASLCSGMLDKFTILCQKFFVCVPEDRPILEENKK